MRVSSVWILALLPVLSDAAFPVCKICGDGVMTNPDGIPIPEATATTCAALQAMGDSGQIIESMCATLQSTVQGNCGCEEDTFLTAEVTCSVCGIPGYDIVEDDLTSMCGSLKVAATMPNLPASSCAELIHFASVLECNCQLIGESDGDSASDVPSDIPSFFPSDAPSDVPSDFPSMAPSLPPVDASGPHPVCNLCGDGVMENPDGSPIPGADLTTCSLLQRQGSQGRIPESVCSELMFNAVEACGCSATEFSPEESCTPLNEVCTTDDECCGDDTACVGFCTIGKKEAIATVHPRLPGDDRSGLRARK